MEIRVEVGNIRYHLEKIRATGARLGENGNEREISLYQRVCLIEQFSSNFAISDRVTETSRTTLFLILHVFRASNERQRISD